MTTVSARTISELCGISKKSVLERSKRENWLCVKEKNAHLFVKNRLPSDIQIPLSRQKTVKQEAENKQSLFDVATEKERKKAKSRLAILNAYFTSGLSAQDFVCAFNLGDISKSLLNETGVLSYRTFMRILQEYKQSGSAESLIPKYSRSAKKAGAGSSLLESEITVLEHFYLTLEKRSIRHCYLLMQHNIPESRASYNTCYRYLKELPPDVVDFYRLGKDKFEAAHYPYIVRNKILYKSLEQVQGDHHKLDRAVMKNGKVVRPWLTSFIDFRSGAILGWVVSTNPCALTITAAYYMMITQYGVPKMVHIDNGKDYKSKMLKGYKKSVKTIDSDGIESEEEVEISGTLMMCGSRVSYARAYHGQSKGVQERFYGILEEYYSKDTGNYLGSNTASRVDDMNLYWRNLRGQAKREDVTEWQEFVYEIANWMQWYNNEWISNAEGREGKTPMQSFIENLPETVLKPNTETLELSFTKGEVKKVCENGIRIGRRFFSSDVLLSITGQNVIVRKKLANPDEVIICDTKGRKLCTATADYYLESGNMEKDNERINAARRDKLAIVRGKFTPDKNLHQKNIVDIAIEASGASLPEPEQFVLLEEENEQKVVGLENTAKSGKYIDYFDATHKEFLK